MIKISQTQINYPQPAEEIYPDPTDEIPFLNALKDKASALLDPMSAQQSLRKLAKATLDNKTGKKLDRSVEMLLAEYMSHKYLEKGGRDHKVNNSNYRAIRYRAIRYRAIVVVSFIMKFGL